MEIDDSRIVWIDTAMMQRLGEYRNLLIGRLDGCTAVVCYNDQIAFEAASILNSVDIRVPEDISLISIDDSELAALGGCGFDLNTASERQAWGKGSA